ncbi:MAG: UDP-2,3-diacylglucosamine diphosphatase LpxI [Spirochaetia bacterium]|nr:UDP-2,3-diacylglucosamine diphosphatase LpxI [Spirochaetia bacterium]
MAQSGSPAGRLGILAGLGDLPFLAAREALKAGEDVLIFPYTDDPVPEDLQNRSHRVILTKMFTSVLRTMIHSGVDRLLLLGKAKRNLLYENPSFDLRSLWVLLKMKNQSDTNMFSYFSGIFLKKGIRIIPQNTYLKHLSLPVGRYGKKLSKRELDDVVFSLHYAKELNRLDIGQTVVAGSKAILSVEAAEGTDQCIRRGGKLYHEKGAVVCKIAKPDHDMRFDMPAAGYETLFSMKESGCRVIAIDSKNTLVIDPPEFLKCAKRFNISIVSIDPYNFNYKLLNQSPEKSSGR